MYELNRLVAVIKPTTTMLAWLNNMPSNQETPLTLAILRQDCTVLLIPPMDSEQEVHEYFDAIYHLLFESEVNAWINPGMEELPQDISYELFTQWFDIEIHSVAYDLAAAESMVRLGKEDFDEIDSEELLEFLEPEAEITKH